MHIIVNICFLFPDDEFSLLNISGLVMAILSVYHPREPKASPLWRIFDRHYDDFEKSYAEKFEIMRSETCSSDRVFQTRDRGSGQKFSAMRRFERRFCQDQVPELWQRETFIILM